MCIYSSNLQETLTNDETHRYEVFILYRIHRQLVSLVTGIEKQNTIQNRVNVTVVVWVNQTWRADGLQTCQPPVYCIHQPNNLAVSTRVNKTESSAPSVVFRTKKVTSLYDTIIRTVQNIMCIVFNP